MKISVILFAMFCSISLFAQPVLLDWYNYNIGDQFNYQIVTNPPTNNTTIVATGSNVVWDYSSLLLEDTLRLNKILDYSASGAPNSFPGCTFVLEEYTGTQQFYHKSGDTVYYMGNLHNGATSNYTPYAPLFAAPFNFNGQVSKTGMLVTSPGYSGYWYTNMDYKAYGTLKLPNNIEYTNVALLYGDLGSADNGYKSLSFNWVLPGEKTPILRIQYKKLGGGNPTIELAYVRSDYENLGLEKVENDLEGTVYPNPFEDEFVVKFDNSTDCKLTLINNLGQLVKEMEVKGVTDYKFQTEDLIPGVYMFLVQVGENTKQMKIVKR